MFHLKAVIMRNILVPTDFSDNATNALEYAIALFKYDISAFFIMHAYQDAIYADAEKVTRANLPEITNKVANQSTAKLETLLAYVNKISQNPRHTYHIISSNNVLVDGVDNIVDEQNIDIIVMGTRGFTNNKQIAFGSHTLQVLKYVQCPVLVIPENYKYTQPKHIVFPTNYLIPYKRRELKLLCEMACPYRAEIDVVYISQSDKLSLRQQDNRDFIKDVLYKNPLNFKTIKAKNVANTIQNYIAEKGIDMLVMVNSRHSFLENMLLQSTIDKMSLHLAIPFFVLQNINRDTL